MTLCSWWAGLISALYWVRADFPQGGSRLCSDSHTQAAICPTRSLTNGILLVKKGSWQGSVSALVQICHHYWRRKKSPPMTVAGVWVLSSLFMKGSTFGPTPTIKLLCGLLSLIWYQKWLVSFEIPDSRA